MPSQKNSALKFCLQQAISVSTDRAVGYYMFLPVGVVVHVKYLL